MNNIWDKIGEFVNAVVKIDEKVGFRKLLNYVFLLLALLLIFNFRTVTKDIIEFVQEISNQIHDDKMVLRDELMADVAPMLQEFRVKSDADRILYFEYHNSKENLVGTPFKFIDLVQQNVEYGLPSVPLEPFKDINVGIITGLYTDLLKNSMIVCRGEEDYDFIRKYPEAYNLFTSDGSKKFVFVSIPGIKQPLGLIVLEWIDCDLTDDIIEELPYIEHQYVARINALLLSKKQ